MPAKKPREARGPAGFKNPPADALLLRPEAACRLLGVGKDSFRKILPELESFTRGRARFVTRRSIDAWISVSLEGPD